MYQLKSCFTYSINYGTVHSFCQEDYYLLQLHRRTANMPYVKYTVAADEKQLA